MSMTPYLSLGLEFGAEAGRALLVETRSGRELASVSQPYAHGTMDRSLPLSLEMLPPDFFLQHPADYLQVTQATIAAVLELAGAQPDQIVSLGVASVAGTLLPLDADGQPLCFQDAWKMHPHAWLKMTQHAAPAQAAWITELAAQRQEPWLARWGGRVPPEAGLSKILQAVEEAPELYAATARFVEVGDWLIEQLTGVVTRNTSAVGFFGLWQKNISNPSTEFLLALDERLTDLLEKKWVGPVMAPGTRAGGLSRAGAQLTGLPEGTAVAVATTEALAPLPGAGVAEAGRMVVTLGAMSSHILILSEKESILPGLIGPVLDGILPGFFGYSLQHDGPGPTLQWFVERMLPPGYFETAQARGSGVYAVLEAEAEQLQPGEHGLLAWSVSDAMGGLLLGATPRTASADIYRALLEAAAFRTRLLLETCVAQGVPVRGLVASGVLAQKIPLLMQIYADVLQRPVEVSRSQHLSALGAAILGAVAAGEEAGGYATFLKATAAMVPTESTVYMPKKEHQAIYDRLFAEFLKLQRHFSSAESTTLRALHEMRHEVLHPKPAEAAL